LDGTISVAVAENKKGFSLISAFRTKSAGKNKFQINWFAGKYHIHLDLFCFRINISDPFILLDLNFP
jgi:hypothetical protein